VEGILNQGESLRLAVLFKEFDDLGAGRDVALAFGDQVIEFRVGRIGRKFFSVNLDGGVTFGSQLLDFIEELGADGGAVSREQFHGAGKRLGLTGVDPNRMTEAVNAGMSEGGAFFLELTERPELESCNGEHRDSEQDDANDNFP
jgi:hypothetical protein